MADEVLIIPARADAGGERDKHGLPLVNIDDVPTFFCWTCMGRFHVTGDEFHRQVGHDTTLRDVSRQETENDTTLRELPTPPPVGEEKEDG